MTTDYTEAIERNLEGLGFVSVGCLGEQCEHAEGDHDFRASRFTEAITCQRCGLLPLDDTDADSPCLDTSHQCEAGFSWEACDSCGSGLGGDRSPGFAFPLQTDDGKSELGEPIELSLCVDCVMYHANGDVPEAWEG